MTDPVSPTHRNGRKLSSRRARQVAFRRALGETVSVAQGASLCNVGRTPPPPASRRPDRRQRRQTSHSVSNASWRGIGRSLLKSTGWQQAHIGRSTETRVQLTRPRTRKDDPEFARFCRARHAP